MAAGTAAGVDAPSCPIYTAVEAAIPTAARRLRDVFVPDGVPSLEIRAPLGRQLNVEMMLRDAAGAVVGVVPLSAAAAVQCGKAGRSVVVAVNVDVECSLELSSALASAVGTAAIGGVVPQSAEVFVRLDDASQVRAPSGDDKPATAAALVAAHAALVVPVPVRVLRADGRVDLDDASSSDPARLAANGVKLARGFVVRDTLLGTPVGATGAYVITLAQSVTLVIRRRSASHVAVPLLIVRPASVDVSALDAVLIGMGGGTQRAAAPLPNNSRGATIGAARQGGQAQGGGVGALVGLSQTQSGGVNSFERRGVLLRLPVSFHVAHLNSGSNGYKTAMTWLWGIALVVGAMLACGRISGYSLRRHMAGAPGATPLVVDLRSIATAALNVVSATSLFLLYLPLAAAVFYVVVYRLQAVPYVLPPPSAHPFGALLLAACIGRGVTALHRLTVAAGCDIFLLDWSTPPLPKGGAGQDDDTRMITDGHGSSGAARASQTASGSCWRLVFVANTFLRLQTTPRFRMLTMLGAVSMLCKWEAVVGFMREQSTVVDDIPAPLSPLLIAGCTTVVILIVSGALYLFDWGVFYRFLRYEPRLEYIDLASFANVSTFLITYGRWGHYLHGKATATCDTSVADIYDQLAKEAAGTAPPRGLAPNSQARSFELYLKPSVRTAWLQEYADAVTDPTARIRNDHCVVALSEAATATLAHDGDAALSVPGSHVMGSQTLSALLGVVGILPRPTLSNLTRAHERLRRRLAVEVDKAIDRAAESVRLPTFLGLWLGFSPEAAYETRSVFTHDAGLGFTRVLLQGVEPTLFLMVLSIYVYMMVTYNAEPEYALCVSAAAYQCAVALFRRMATANMPRKALVDEQLFTAP